ncbi:hypothetical protein P1J78_12325 [Psychromarinibacter sp. C21-152]|uniref:Uncharacterized protein n=1 Tax=Psychromarinibacter sediminicola TaxID=3033385 RepID=A0AAE3T8R2_9RHOB|nr:hypothetical protein [Psychromarinibacter sediminicola]MDF0601522.1 hypothetical protein [Psychromarinibacter sediminicola]
MKVALDSTVVAGGVRIAAICRRHVGGRAGRAGLAAAAEKTPLAILIDAGQGTRAVDMAGDPLDFAAVEALCPGAWRRFEDGH